MDNLIKALIILRKYGNPQYPTNCSHDELWVNIRPNLVSKKDKGILDELGFFESEDGFKSFEFGNCLGGDDAL